MLNRDDGSDMAAKLRWRAEERWQDEEAARPGGGATSHTPGTLSAEESKTIIHELRVHQIELEMQNLELRRVQAELDASRAHYFDLYDLAPVGYFILSMEGLILEVNHTGVVLLGAARSTLVKQPITRFILKEDQDIYYLHRKRLHESNAPHSCELRLVKPDGTTLWVSLSSTPPNAERNPEGSPVSRLVVSDISERKRVELEHADLLAKVQQGRDHGPVGSNVEPVQGRINLS